MARPKFGGRGGLRDESVHRHLDPQALDRYSYLIISCNSHFVT